MKLTPPQARVLGCLVEKQLSTPQHYPLSVNALVGACNQTTNRDPVVAYDEDTVRSALVGLRDHSLVRTFYATGSRTPKYTHHLDSHFDLTRPQIALVALLLLRGPQTVGELRTRSERMHAFDALADVDAELRALAEHPSGALVELLERRPGQKEARWRHLLGGEEEPEASPVRSAASSAPAAAPIRTGGVTLESLAAEVAELRAEVAGLRARLGHPEPPSVPKTPETPDTNSANAEFGSG